MNNKQQWEVLFARRVNDEKMVHLLDKGEKILKKVEGCEKTNPVSTLECSWRLLDLVVIEPNLRTVITDMCDVSWDTIPC